MTRTAVRTAVHRFISRLLENQHDFDDNSNLMQLGLDKEDIETILEIFEYSLQSSSQTDELFQYHWNYTFRGKIILQISENIASDGYILYFPSINLKVPTTGSGFNLNKIHNPLFNINLQ